MNSSIINISEILNNAEGFISAGFSDGYNFDGVNASEYFDELLENATYPSPIFSGILIMKKSGEIFTIADGLQRITTISLLLCALYENYKDTSKKNEEASNKIFYRYLINKTEPKLRLAGKEQEIYKKILFSKKLSEDEEKSNLFQAYKSFCNKVRGHKIPGTELFRILSKIQFMVVLVENSEVSTRELYQALNNNKEKSQINLVSDFIVQKIDDDEDAKSHWQKAVDSYKKLGLQYLFESFVKDFLVIQNDGKAPNKNALYNNFKSYFSKMSNYQNTETIIKNIYNHSQYYLKIINADFEDFEIQKQITTLNENNGKDAYPYLMEVLDDLENAHINRDVFLNILVMINSFIQHRQEEPLSDAVIDFASLSKEINKMLILKDYTPSMSDLADENKLSINEINNLSTFGV